MNNSIHPYSELANNSSPSTSSTPFKLKVSNDTNRLFVSFRGDRFVDVEEDDYARELLTRVGDTDVVTIPPLGFEFVGRSELVEALKYDVDKWSGLVVTSRRVVTAISDVLRDDCESRQQWAKKPIFAVGETTAADLKHELNWTSRGFQTGSSQQLAHFMIDNFRSQLNRPLLMPCGNLRKDCLPNLLQNAGIDLHEICVYKTCNNPILSQCLEIVFREISAFLQSNTRFDTFDLFAVFFSPSGYNLVVPSLDLFAQDSRINLRFVAIGPTTADAIVDSGKSVWCTSSKPNAKSLAESIAANLVLS